MLLNKKQSNLMKTLQHPSGMKPKVSASGTYSQFVEARYGISSTSQLFELKKHLKCEESEIQVQAATLNDMLCLSPMLHRMKTNVAHTINKSKCSPNKDVHILIHSL